MIKTNQNKTVAYKISILVGTLLVLLFGGFTQTTTVVQAKDLMAGVTEPMDPSKPHTWDQCGWSWSGETFPIWGETYCQSSCGAHSIAWMFMKAGIWGDDKTPKDAWEYIERSGWAYAGSGGYVSMASSSEGGKAVTLKGQAVISKEWLRDQYEKGYFVLINVPGHFIAMDYVDEDGDIVVLDSAKDRCVYLDCVEARWGTGGTAYAYEIEGSDARESIQLQNGGQVGSGSSSNSNSGKSSNSGCRQGNVDYCADPFEPIENPIVEYDEDDLTLVGSSSKGLSRNNKGWLDWLFK